MQFLSKSITISNASTNSVILIQGLVQITNISGSGRFYTVQLRKGTTVIATFDTFLNASSSNNETGLVPVLFIDSATNATHSYNYTIRDSTGISSSVDSVTVHPDTTIISLGGAKR